MSQNYLDVSGADTLATTVVGLTSWAGATSDEKEAALNQAATDVDAAMPYQGRPVDPAQEGQFPRVAYEQIEGDNYPAPPAHGADEVWDWDADANVPVVPARVKLAVLYQADSILASTREPRLSAQHDGVVYELTGTLAESYKQTTGPGVSTGLCRRAWVIMRRYRLRSGRVL